MGFFLKIEFDAWLTSSRTNLRSSLRTIVHFVMEIQRFVCDRATPPVIKKLRSKDVAMNAYGVSAYYLCVNRKSFKFPWAEPFEMNVKIEQGSNFVVHTDSRKFFDAQEA